MAKNYKCLTGIAFLVLLMSVGPAMAAARKMSVIMVTGDVTYKRGAANPRPIRKTTRLKPKDVVRTRVESSVELRLDDGSVLKIEENSVINLAKLLKEGDVTNNKVVIKTGKVMFNVKKLASKRSDFVFETPTATAAIRGTIGGIGTNGKSTFAYLEEGGLELKPKGGGKAVLIKTLNVAIQKAKGFEVQAVVSNAALAQAIAVVEKVMQDTTAKKQEIILDSLINKIDSASIDSLKTDSIKTDRGDSINADTTSKLPDSVKVDTVARRHDSVSVNIDSSSVLPPKDSVVSVDSVLPGTVLAPDSTIPPSDTLKSARKDSVPTSLDTDTTANAPLSVGDSLSAKTGQTELGDTLLAKVEKSAKDSIETLAANENSELLKTSQPNDTNASSSEKQDTVTASTLPDADDEGAASATNPEVVAISLEIATPAEGAEIGGDMMDVSGTTAPGATIKTRNVQVVADASGQFALQLKAPGKPGKYNLTVNTELNGQTLEKKVRFIVPEKVKPLAVQILSPVSGQSYLEGNDVAVNGTVNPGATVTVNGTNAQVNGDKWAVLLTGLKTGEHNVSVEASLAGQSANAEAQFTMTKKQAVLQFALLSPKDEAEINSEQILVSGSGTPGAKVTVQGVSTAIDASGTWRLSIPTPGTPGDYNLQAESVLDDQTISKEISFSVPERALMLEVVTPSDGDEVTQSIIQVSGRATAGANIQVFEARTRADASGTWSANIQAPSKEGDYTLAVNAVFGTQTATKEVSIVRVIPKQPLKGAVNSVPSEINKSEITLSGSCNDGATIEAGNFSTQSKGGVWSMKVSWPEEEEGAIRFEVFCLFNDEEAVIGEVELEYTRPRIPLVVNMSTPSSVNLKSNSLEIRGDVQGRDVKVEVDGRGVAVTSNRFAHTLKFSQQNWDVTEVEVLVTDGVDEVTKTIEIEVDKTSPQVNTNRPEFVNGPSIFNDEAIRYGVKDDAGDELEVTLYVDNDEVEEFNFDGSVTGKTFDLVAGLHDYKIEVVDLAGNKTIWERRNVSYWPRVEWTIEVVSPRADRVIYQPPYNPDRDFQPQTDIQIRIKSLPDDDYRYLKEVRITNEANRAERIWRDIEIDDIEFEFEDMPLVPRQVNLVTIQVEPQKGPIRRMTRKFTMR